MAAVCWNDRCGGGWLGYCDDIDGDDVVLVDKEGEGIRVVGEVESGKGAADAQGRAERSRRRFEKRSR